MSVSPTGALGADRVKHAAAPAPQGGSGMTTPRLRRRGARQAPLSAAQEGLWYLSAARPDEPTYNVPWVVPCRRPLDPPAWQVALDTVVARHEILRTTYPVREEGPVQSIAAPGSVPVEVIDLTGVTDAAGEARQQARQRAAEPFRLDLAPPLRCTLWRGLPDGDLLLLCLHHIAIDGWSVPVLFEELWTVYEAALAGREPALPTVGLQYADFAAWEREVQRGEAHQRLVRERAEQLTEMPTELVLGWRSPDQLGAPLAAALGEQCGFTLTGAVSEHLHTLARQLRVTPFLLLMAAFQETVRRWSGGPRFLLGTAMVNRPGAELDRTLGYFVNTVPVRCQVLPQDTFAQHCGQVRTEFAEAMRHQTVPLEQLAHALGADRARGVPLIQVGFVMLGTAPVLAGARVLASSLALPTGTAKFDLAVLVEPSAEGFTITMEFATARYARSTVEGIRDTFRGLLEAALTEPGLALARLPIAAGRPVMLSGPDVDLPADHRRRVLTTGGGSPR